MYRTSQVVLTAYWSSPFVLHLWGSSVPICPALWSGHRIVICMCIRICRKIPSCVTCKMSRALTSTSGLLSAVLCTTWLCRNIPHRSSKTCGHRAAAQNSSKRVGIRFIQMRKQAWVSLREHWCASDFDSKHNVITLGPITPWVQGCNEQQPWGHWASVQYIGGMRRHWSELPHYKYARHQQLMPNFHVLLGNTDQMVLIISCESPSAAHYCLLAGEKLQQECVQAKHQSMNIKVCSNDSVNLML